MKAPYFVVDFICESNAKDYFPRIILHFPMYSIRVKLVNTIHEAKKSSSNDTKW